MNNQNPDKNKVINAINALMQSLGITKHSQLWIKADLYDSRSHWYKRMRPDDPTPITLEDLQILVKGLRDNENKNYYINDKKVAMLYQSLISELITDDPKAMLLEETLAKSNYQEQVKIEDFSERFLQEYILDNSRNAKFRIRAFNLYINLNMVVPDTFNVLFDDIDEDMQLAALTSVEEDRLIIDVDTLQKKMTNPPIKVAIKSIIVIKKFIKEEKCSVAILVAANDFNSQLNEGYSVRLAAIRAIVEFDPPNSVELLCQCTRVSYHVTIRVLIKYFHELKQRGDLNGERLDNVVNYLRLIQRKKVTTLTSQRVIEKAIEELTS